MGEVIAFELATHKPFSIRMNKPTELTLQSLGNQRNLIFLLRKMF